MPDQTKSRRTKRSLALAALVFLATNDWAPTLLGWYLAADESRDAAAEMIEPMNDCNDEADQEG